jgi:hypothetical protein
MKSRPVIASIVIAIPLAFLSYLFLDQRLSTLSQEFILSHDVLMKVTSNIPDQLPLIVRALTVLSWLLYFFLSFKGLRNRRTRFAQLCGVSVPLAFIVKALLKSAFGHVDTRIWVDHHGLAGLHYWFPALPACYVSPSGHMTVFTALAVALCYIYPRYRRIYLASLTMLGLALVITNYHLLSDVIFGASLGLLICYMADSGLTRVSSSYRQGDQIANAETVL